MKKFLAALILAAMMFTGTVAESACTSAITSIAKQLAVQGYFEQTDTFKMAFYTDTAAFGAATTAYSATNEVSGSGYSAGGYTLTGPTVTLSGTTAFYDFTDVSENPVTFSAASTCAVVYDSTDKSASCTGSGEPYACCTGSSTGCAGTAPLFVLNFSSIQPNAGTLTVTWPTADASNAIVRLGD